jgi:1-acyl-sn-glycerol-3-phosphate acyltransferase
MSERRRRARETMQRRLSARSPLFFSFFVRVFERTLRKNFNTVRMANRPSDEVLQYPQLVVFSNHPSWWDGVTFLYLAGRLFAGRNVFTPIDNAALGQYGFIGRVGAFGIEQQSAEGALHFLEACKIIFSDPRNLLLVTAQGRFSDCRERPLNLNPGIAHVTDIAPDALFVPLAIEYTHWVEKQPELLLRFGDAISATDIAEQRPGARLATLEQALTVTMDRLARDSIARDETAFDMLMSGGGGVHPLYDMWRRLIAFLSGGSYRPQHGAPP